MADSVTLVKQNYPQAWDSSEIAGSGDCPYNLLPFIFLEL